MRLAIVLGAYLLLNGYVLFRTALFLRRNLPERWSGAAPWALCLICALLALAMVAAFLLPAGSLQRATQRIGNCYEGFAIYLLFCYLLIELVCLALRLVPAARGFTRWQGASKLLAGAALWALLIGVCAYGTVHSSQLTVKRYEAAIDKPCALDRLRVVLIADTHLGYSVGRERIEDMVALVNAQDADLIAFAGDIFDNSTSTMDDPEAVKAALSGMKSRLGTYACWGNHDLDEHLFSGFATVPDSQALRSAEMDEFLRECGITALNDESALLDGGFYLVGRMDYSNAGDGTQDRASIGELLSGLDASMPILVIDHEPRALRDSADAGVDLLLSGHTHDGQFFPLNLTSRLVWENSSGMLRVGDMTSVVTSGVGIYGPDMRVATDADISVVDVTFAAKP